MKKLIAGFAAALCLVTSAVASGDGGVPWDKFPKEKVTDMAALQRGAKLFVNYCLNCHAAAFMRYNRMRDIGLTEEQIKANLVFASEKVGDTMKVSIDPKEAKDWFGANPPDLTVIARSRAGSQGSGADYLYTYLRGFYRDETRPTGWNNTVFPAVGMPHVLWELQGEQRLGEGHKLELAKPGTMNAKEYDEAIGDLVAYLQWMGEPGQTQRQRLGVWVLAFLAIFFVLAWRLNSTFWKDVK
ncbi:cytochrome c1 [Ideonella livida]|uniref:Cytochrome c1 n=1 Tax=Ideonella livida TaxID=2707176 RepID=A0A7C9PES6_9BURK|nr:cytochrome c1 [Ideonella livida]NDY89650.1 cytochrome c1 [Ideonella livida]